MSDSFKEKSKAPISDLSLLPALIIDAEAPALDAIKMIRDTSHGVGSVIENGELIGHIFDKGIVRGLGNAATAKELSEVLLFHLTLTSTIEEAMKMAVIKNLYYLPVLDEKGMVVHYLSVRTLVDFLLQNIEDDIGSFGTLFSWESFCCDEHPGDITLGGTAPGRDVELNDKFYLRQIQVLDSTTLWSIDRDATVLDAQKLLVEKDASVLAVTEFDTQIVGVLSERDFLTRVSLDPIETALNANVCKYFTPNPDTMHFEHRVCYAINNIIARGYRNIIVVNSDKMPVANVSLVDILRYSLKTLLD